MTILVKDLSSAGLTSTFEIVFALDEITEDSAKDESEEKSEESENLALVAAI